MTRRIIAAWFFSAIGLLGFILSDPLNYIDGMSLYDTLSMFAAMAGGVFGMSTWRPTEKSYFGLAGGIIGVMVLLAYLVLIIMSFISSI